MSRPLLGLVTIGQTPRPDFEAVFARHAPLAEIRVAGALDGLRDVEIAALTEENDPYPLLVRLASGRTAEVPLVRIVPRVEACARLFAQQGARLVVVLCAGDFPDFECGVPLLIPGRLLPAAVQALYPGRPVGVVTPIAGQAKAAQAKWARDGFRTVVTWASPTRHDEIAAAADQVRSAELACVVLDCMGHDEAYRQEFARRCGRPVLSAQSLVARAAGRILAGPVTA
jgi:protein AroM